MQEREVFDAIKSARRRGRESELTLLTLVLGSRRYYAWDWLATELERDPTKKLTHRDLQIHADGYTPQQELDFEKSALDSLKRYAVEHPRDESWWRGFWQSLAAAFAWSVFLLLVFLVTQIFGVDILAALTLKK